MSTNLCLDLSIAAIDHRGNDKKKAPEIMAKNGNYQFICFKFRSFFLHFEMNLEISQFYAFFVRWR